MANFLFFTAVQLPYFDDKTKENIFTLLYKYYTIFISSFLHPIIILYSLYNIELSF